VQIALDDFGTGYASLSHLNHFPVDVIKIDRSFISKLEGSPHDAAIVRAVINLGRSLGIKIVGEGVETPAQAAYLRKHRCHTGRAICSARHSRRTSWRSA
jgi:EAL domain-containing protein (putative c-di-GMP-specific phosphodiesterase class I)